MPRQRPRRPAAPPPPLDIVQNASCTSWSREEAERRIDDIMGDIHVGTRTTAAEFVGDPDDYVAGATIAGILDVAEDILASEG